MAIVVYITDQCRQNAAEHGFQEPLETFAQSVERQQSTSYFDPFPPPYLVKKQFGGRQGRLIAQLHTSGEHAVVVFLAVMIRGTAEYEQQFAKDPNDYGRRHFSDAFTVEGLERFVREKTAVAPLPSKPKPSDGENGFLYTAFQHQTDTEPDGIVYETALWVEQVSQPGTQGYLSNLNGACLELLSKSSGLHCEGVANRAGWRVWAYRWEEHLLLITLQTNGDENSGRQEAESLIAKLAGDPSLGIQQVSRRAYPDLVMADADLWMELEREPVGNMALSPEESDVLRSVRRGENPFPLFINGRAGSGKSTILQYLFADLLYFYLTLPDETRSTLKAPPLYLTANAELLDVAGKFVTKLLKTNASYRQRSRQPTEAARKAVVGQSFREFRPFLLSLVPAAERAALFSGKHVGYNTFRSLWWERCGRAAGAVKGYGPDLSWHVIRSYIKGLSSETCLEPDDYAEVSDNQRTVTQDAFETVYKKVWLGWYKELCENGSHWDDQDLARHVLDNNLAPAWYPAIFCDEAQDFTRIELELLLRLNVFSNRLVPPPDISRVPFAFAGDQFQTLNPSGFRWEATKASFVEKFIFEMDPARRSGRNDLNYTELKHNYRSTHTIVKFGNTIQALRSVLFKVQDLQPQTPWTEEREALPVVAFRSDDNSFWEKYSQHGLLVTILPCGAGEELAFVEGDPILSERIPIRDGVPFNVLSAERAKGCEYDEVVLYGFGDQAPTSVMSALPASGEAPAPDPDSSLPLQYFINRVYVGVSRPKQRLIVVDTQKGLDNLWKIALDANVWARVSAMVRHGEAWEGLTEFMAMGSAEDVTRAEAADANANVVQFEVEGKAQHDSYLLNQAALNYKAAGNDRKYQECRALALKEQGDFIDAGDTLLSIHEVQLAIECFWQGGKDGWPKIRKALDDNPMLANDIRVQWALALRKPDLQRAADCLDRVNDLLKADSGFSSKFAGSRVWTDALNALVQPLVSSAQDQERGLFVAMSARLDSIEKAGVSLQAKTRAEVHFHAGEFQQAIEVCDLAAIQPDIYSKAKARVEPYPACVVWLQKLERSEEILSLYDQKPLSGMKREEADVLVRALRDAGRLSDAMRVAFASASLEDLLSLVLLCRQNSQPDDALYGLQAAIYLMGSRKDWESLADLAASGEIKSREWQKRGNRQWLLTEAEAIKAALVRALARAPELDKAPEVRLEPIRAFLRTYLRGRDGAWRRLVTVPEAGAALERAGRIVDALGFYDDDVLGNPSLSAHREFARERWLICKNRQADYEGEQRRTRKEADYRKEIDDSMRSWRIKSVSALPQFPDLPDLLFPGDETSAPMPTAPSPEPASPEPSSGLQTFSAGPLEILWSRDLARCNITHDQTMETAWVKVREGACGGDVDLKELKRGSWRVESWGLTLRIQDGAGGPSGLVLTVEGHRKPIELLL